MKQKEFTSNVFYYLSKEIKDEVCLGYINNIQNIDYENIKIKIHKKKTKQVIVTKDVLYLASYDVQVMDKSLEFVRYLKKKLYNQKIHDVVQDNNNKLIYFKLDKYYLVFEFFSNRNIILTDENFVVISARRYERWKDREVIRHKTYSFPACEPVDKITAETIQGLDKKEIIKKIVKEYNVAPYYIDKIVNEKKDVKTIVKDVKKLYGYKGYCLKKIKDLFVIEEKKDKQNLSINIEKEYLDYFSENKEEKKVSKKQAKIDKILEVQENKQKEFENKIKDLKKQAETIYIHFTLVEEINKQIENALNKGISKKEIITKINDYFSTKKKNMYIKDINLKEKKYVLTVK